MPVSEELVFQSTQDKYSTTFEEALHNWFVCVLVYCVVWTM